MLVIKDGTVLVRDTGSANGTRIGGKRVPSNGEGLVPPGVAVLIGGASLVVHQLGAGAGLGRPRLGERLAVREALVASEHIRALQSGGAAATAPHAALVVESEPMRKLFQLVDRIAPGTISVLLAGETGVGKEVVAAAIHERSPRKGKPYLRLNCSAFAENLLESELFGHEAGAFSGARGAKPGLFETAEGGTVLLDEIGEVPLGIQAKLLRVIETREVIPLGGTRVRKLNVRFLSATNRDLRERIDQGLFREDLYFRLGGVVLEIPPLRERRAEIAALARLFAAEAALALGREPPLLSREALHFLEAQSWPGNVPSEGNTARIDERDRIRAALAACAGNQTRAAAMLGMARRTLVKKLADLGLPRPRA